MLLVNVSSPQLLIYHNEIGVDVDATTNVIAMRFVGGNKTSRPAESWSNRDGYGASIRPAVGPSTIVREHRAGDGLAAQNSATMMVGLGAHSTAASVEIRWPSGRTQAIKDVARGFTGDGLRESEGVAGRLGLRGRLLRAPRTDPVRFLGTGGSARDPVSPKRHGRSVVKPAALLDDGHLVCSLPPRGCRASGARRGCPDGRS